jgi:hypothetical protein
MVTATPSIRSTRIQEGDHRQDTTVIVAGLRQTQLGQNAAHVLLHRPLSDPQPTANTGIGTPLGHQRQHLPLPSAEHRQRSLRRRADTSSCTSAGSTTEPPLAIRSNVSTNSATSVTRLLSR